MFFFFVVFVVVTVLFTTSPFLALQDAQGSSCMFPALVLEAITSSRSPGSCNQRIALEINTWILGILVTNGVSFDLDPPKQQRRKMC